MRTNKIYIFNQLSSLLVIVLSFLILSCDRDFLDRMPEDRITPEAFFNTPEDLKLFANRFYPLLPAHRSYFYTFMIDQNSDNLAPGMYDTRLAGTRTIPSSASSGNWTWSDIRQANYFLEHCNSAEGSTSEINQYIGEVKFFRAFLYFDKVQTFGNVPWISKPLNTDSEELMMPQSDRNVIIDSILIDLDLAIQYLPLANKVEQGRINKETALLLKARVCLYEGTWEKYHEGDVFGVQNSNGVKYIEEAAETAKELMDMKTFSIYKGPSDMEYGALFNQLDYSGNPEVLLWKKFDLSLQVTHNYSRTLSAGGGNTGITKRLVDSYLCTDGNPISISSEFKGYHSLIEEFTNRDPRLLQTVYKKGDWQSIDPLGEFDGLIYGLPTLDATDHFKSTTGYGVRKGINTDFRSQQYAENIGTVGSIIFRYAEALLIYAEAKAELGEFNQEDADISINLLRNRVNMPHLKVESIQIDPNWDFPDLSPIINEIRRERRVEMALEGTRWDDLARWKAHHIFIDKRPKGVKYIGSDLEGAYKNAAGKPTINLGVNLFVDENGFVDPYQNSLPQGYKFKPQRDYLSPIPTDELALNPNLKQNPGW